MAPKRKREKKNIKNAKQPKLEVANSSTDEEKQEDVSKDLKKMAPLSKGRWTNKQKVLVFASRGVPYKGRHLLKDFQNLMPHTKTDVKLDCKHDILLINEICEMKSCNKCVFLMGKKRKDVYMWISNVPHGPSALFHVEYINMMKELKFSGNCLTSSRAILSFDKKFDKSPHMQLIKEMFIQIFGTPRYHPKSQPFIDHVFTFSLLDGKIWFRNYQIVEENGELNEVGPRFTMTLARILSGSFGRSVLYINPEYKSPNLIRHLQKKEKSQKYIDKRASVADRDSRRSDKTFAVDESDQVFHMGTK